MESVQPETYLVVIVNQFAPKHARANFLWLFIKAEEHGVKILAGIAQESFSGLTYGSAVARLLLGELIDPQHLPGQIGNRLHAFKVAKLGRGRQTRDGE